MKKILILSAFIFVGYFSFALQVHAETPACQTFETNNGYYFDDIHRVEYQNGLLQIHFKVKTPYNDGRGWAQSLYFYDSNCTPQNIEINRADMHSDPDSLNYSIRFSTDHHYDVWDDDTKTKIDCSSCSIDIPDNIDTKTYLFSYQPHIDGSSSFIKVEAVSILGKDALPAKPPLIIIPGILGTEFYEGQNKLWLDPLKIVSDSQSSFLDHLALDDKGQPLYPEATPGNVIGNVNYVVGSFNYTQSLIDDLTSKGYTLNKDLYLFPYDWRIGLDNLSNKLDKFILNVSLSAKSEKVDVIAHSYGGLILKSYISVKGDSSLDKAIFVGVPHLGSADAAKTLLFGGNLDIPFLNDKKVNQITRNMPSIYELLPSREYFKHIAGFYDDLTSPFSKAILNYEDSELFLKKNKNVSLLNQAATDHSKIDNLNSASAKIYNIASCGLYTIKTINKMHTGIPTFFQKLIQDTKYKIVPDSGDGEVLLGSANYLKGVKNLIFPKIKHGQLLSNKSSKDALISLLDNKEVAQTSPDCSLRGKLINLSSDIDYQIVNNKNEKIDPSEFVETKLQDQKIIYIPENDETEYKIIFASKNEQPLNFKITDFGNDNSTKNYENIKIDDNSKININISSKTERVEKESANSLDSIEPSSEENSSNSTLITSILNSSNQTSGSSGLVLNPDRLVKFTVNVADAKTYYSFNQQNWQEYSGTELTVSQEISKIYFYSEYGDNQEDVQEVKFMNSTKAEDTIPPEEVSAPNEPALENPIPDEPLTILPNEKPSQVNPLILETAPITIHLNLDGLKDIVEKNNLSSPQKSINITYIYKKDDSLKKLYQNFIKFIGWSLKIFF